MKVILLENLRKIGSIGDVIDVKRGFARNYLIANKKALYASKENIKEVEKIKSELGKKDLEKRKAAKKEAKRETEVKQELKTILEEIMEKEGNFEGQEGNSARNAGDLMTFPKSQCSKMGVPGSGGRRRRRCHYSLLLLGTQFDGVITASSSWGPKLIKNQLKSIKIN